MVTTSRTENLKIEFYPLDGAPLVLRIPRFDSESIEVARKRAERISCKSLPVDAQLGFPRFRIYKNDKEIGSN